MRINTPLATVGVVLAVVIPLGGCLKPKGVTGPKPTKTSPPLPTMSVGAGAGSVTIRVEPSNQLAYIVSWKSAVVTATDPVHLEGSGNFKGVSGTLYKAGIAAAEFSADEGTVDTAKGVLTLRRNVNVTAIGGTPIVKGTKVRCDVVNYATADEIIKASGNVMVQNADYTLGPLGDAWCSNTLSEVASPSEFVPVRHNQPATPHP